MPGRKYSSESSYRYGFNGKENDNDVKGEGNQQDYGMRIYDTRLVRFLSRDPLNASYPHYTPYQFAGNTPIQAIDLDGEEPEGYSTSAKFRHPGREWIRTEKDARVGSNVHGQWFRMQIKDAVGAQYTVFRREIQEIASYGSYHRLVTRVDFYYLDNSVNAPIPGKHYITNSDGVFAGNLIAFDARERTDMKQNSAIADGFQYMALGIVAAPVALESTALLPGLTTASASSRGIGVLGDYVSQVAGNHLAGRRGFDAAIGNINITSLGISALNPVSGWKSLGLNSTAGSAVSATFAEGYNGLGGGKSFATFAKETGASFLAGALTMGTVRRTNWLTGRQIRVNNLTGLGQSSSLSISLGREISQTQNVGTAINAVTGSVSNAASSEKREP